MVVIGREATEAFFGTNDFFPFTAPNLSNTIR
jgi:hypothetical protein